MIRLDNKQDLNYVASKKKCSKYKDIDRSKVNG